MSRSLCQYGDSVTHFQTPSITFFLKYCCKNMKVRALCISSGRAHILHNNVREQNNWDRFRNK